MVVVRREGVAEGVGERKTWSATSVLALRGYRYRKAVKRTGKEQVRVAHDVKRDRRREKGPWLFYCGVHITRTSSMRYTGRVSSRRGSTISLSRKGFSRQRDHG